MNYDRKIKYFDYNKDSERLRGAGFAKMEVRGNICKLQLQISGLHMTDTFRKQVYLVTKNREEELDSIELQGGKGALHKQLSVDNLCSGISYGELMAIRIPIAAGYELYCQVRDDIEQEQNKVSGEIDIVGENEEMANGSIVEQEDAMEVTTTEQNPVAQELHKQEDMHEESDMKERDDTAHQTMLSTKWEQLSAIYPHIQPFHDDRDYLKLGPEDFVVLGHRSYQLAHNSFLLHGYYNYKHLILSRQEWRNEQRYYIGVPGNFYEREKQVALMFGFESFECREEPADMGAYGYYMIRVDI